MRVSGESSATGKLLIAGRFDGDGVLHRAEAAGVERAHVENVNTIHLSENLETLETGSLLQIGGDSARGGAGTEKVFVALYLCSMPRQSIPSPSTTQPSEARHAPLKTL